MTAGGTAHKHMNGVLEGKRKVSRVWPHTQVRRVCLAFESVEVGQHMLAWATKYCLFPDDEVYIVHCFSKVGAGFRCLASSPERISFHEAAYTAVQLISSSDQPMLSVIFALLSTWR